MLIQPSMLVAVAENERGHADVIFQSLIRAAGVASLLVYVPVILSMARVLDAMASPIVGNGTMDADAEPERGASAVMEFRIAGNKTMDVDAEPELRAGAAMEFRIAGNRTMDVDAEPELRASAVMEFHTAVRK